MTPAHTPADIARAHMVDSQVRPNQVNDARVIAAMRALPREAFAPAGAQAYADADIDLGQGRFMLAPMSIARLTQLVLASSPQHILVIAAGAGYGAAILAAAGASVTALESQPRLQTANLAAVMAAITPAITPAITQVTGPLAAGWPAAGPYDAILIEGAVAEIPASLKAQLTPAGFIVAIIADPGAKLGHAVIARPSPGGYALITKFDITARPLPEFIPAPAFTF